MIRRDNSLFSAFVVVWAKFLSFRGLTGPADHDILNLPAKFQEVLRWYSNQQNGNPSKPVLSSTTLINDGLFLFPDVSCGHG